VCKGDVGRFSVGAPGGGAPRAGGPCSSGAGCAGGPGAAPAGAAAPGPGAAANQSAAGPVAAAAPGARGGRGGAAAAQPPVVLSRNGRELAITGGTNVRAGTEIKVATERPSMSLILTEMDAGSWVVLELPGFTTAASGTEQSSLDALRKASETSYFKGQDALWVKLVSNGNGARGPIGGGPGGGTSLQVSR